VLENQDGIMILSVEQQILAVSPLWPLMQVSPSCPKPGS